jgi:hypothetical protein
MGALEWAGIVTAWRDTVCVRHATLLLLVGTFTFASPVVVRPVVSTCWWLGACESLAEGLIEGSSKFRDLLQRRVISLATLWEETCRWIL